MGKVIGLTGGIASGKSAVADILANNGYFIIDADKMTHRLYKKGEKGSLAVANAFGSEYICKNGCVDRKKLRDFVFDNEDALKRLNGIMHPLIKDEIMNEISRREKCVVEAALLFQAGYDDICDEVWFVAADRDIQIKRIRKRDSLSEELAGKIIESQKSLDGYMSRADVVIYNNGDLNELEQKVAELIDE